MFDELKNYTETGHFFFTLNDDLDTKCNAPSGKPGVFIIYVLKKSGGVELYYIGSSGISVSADSELALQPNGLRETIVEGKRDKNLDRLHWIQAMKREEH